MIRRYRFLIMLALCVAGSVPLGARSVPDISGVWVGKIALNDGGTDPVSVTLKKDGPSYAGTIVDERGLMPEGTGLEDVSLEGNDLSLRFRANDDSGVVVIKVFLTVSGETMTGRWEDEQNGTGGSVDLARKK